MRIKRLDILRFVAVVLVITHHTGVPGFTAGVGWIGVDLFFVLSGFLISGLLYSEYKKRGSIAVSRFLLRRGLKIYPGFYVSFLSAILAQRLGWSGLPNAAGNYVRELVFLQNYGQGIWEHTWSLAVEEHFYLGLALLFVLLVRLSKGVPDPFRRIPQICLGLAMACITMRAIAVLQQSHVQAGHPHPVYFMSHTRVDSLFFGVFLGYLHHFRPETITRFFRTWPHRIAIAALCALLVSTPYFAPRSTRVCVIVGFTLLYLGFGGLLLLSLEVRGVLKGRMALWSERIGNACAYIGKHSYSIYLWHLPFILFAPVALRKFAHIQTPPYAFGAFCMPGACVSGILFAHAIEFPVLRIRDRLFPALRPEPTPTMEPAIPAGFPVRAKARAAGAAR